VQAATAFSAESNHVVADWAVDGDPNTRWDAEGPKPEEQCRIVKEEDAEGLPAPVERATPV
jgi:hypothetical protein